MAVKRKREGGENMTNDAIEEERDEVNDEVADVDPGENADNSNAGPASVSSGEQCKKVDKVVKEVGGASVTEWHCHGCGAVFTDKKEERKHAYRTNVWLRKHGKPEAQKSQKTSAKAKQPPGEALEVEEGVLPAGEGEEELEPEAGSSAAAKVRRKPKRGRRGGVLHARKEACKDWQAGKCEKGPRCKYLHGPREEADGGAEGQAGPTVSGLSPRQDRRKKEKGGTAHATSDAERPKKKQKASKAESAAIAVTELTPATTKLHGVTKEDSKAKVSVKKLSGDKSRAGQGLTKEEMVVGRNNKDESKAKKTKSKNKDKKKSKVRGIVGDEEPIDAQLLLLA
eukprot:jgi/Mesen1/8627/ME000050S08036